MSSITHTTVATGTDAGNGQIGKSQWNESHTLTGTASSLLGFTSGGAATDYLLSSNLRFNTGTLDLATTLYLGGAAGSESLRVGPTASAVNYLQAAGSTTGNKLVLSGQGGDTNVSIRVYPKGTGYLEVYGDTDTALMFTGASQSFHTQMIQSADVFKLNVLNPSFGLHGTFFQSDLNSKSFEIPAAGTQFSGNGTTTSLFMGYNGIRMYSEYGEFSLVCTGNGAKFLRAVGPSIPADTLYIGSTGYVSLAGTAGAEALRAVPTASAVNWMQVAGSATTNAVRLDTNGSDTDIGAVLVAKGAGFWAFCTSASSSNTQFKISHTASAVNFVQVTGAATGNYPAIYAQGSDANISLTFYAKGTSPMSFVGNNAEQFRVGAIASAANYIYAYGGATGTSPTIAAAGSDSNLDLNMNIKGTGVLATNYAPTTAASVASTHKLQVKLNGTTYYILLSNV